MLAPKGPPSDLVLAGLDLALSRGLAATLELASMDLAHREGWPRLGSWRPFRAEAMQASPRGSLGQHDTRGLVLIAWAVPGQGYASGCPLAH